MNMTGQRRQLLWLMINDQMEEQIDKKDAEYIAEQWWAEIEYPDDVI